ncbi:putative allergen Asp f 4 [Tricladium varicosporioides]|nr:putative allergen Asp f 4 [Hymenoscyphus varicosporioides]
MRTSAASGLMLAALIGNAVAGPTHMHLHQKVHEKKDVQERDIDWNNLGIDWSSAWAEGQKTKTAASATTSTEAKATGAVFVEEKKSTKTATATSAKATSSSSSSSSDLSILGGIIGASNNLKSFGTATEPSGTPGDNYIPNIGSPYGSNIIKVDSINGYAFTNTFVNSQSTAITINIWNKVGPDMQVLSGPMLAPKKTTLTFALAPGASQIVAIQENTSYGWAQACTKITSYGAYDTTWGEATVKSSGSGYDVSAIPNTAGNVYNMSISSAESTCISDMTQNYWLTATQPIGTSDGSCFIAQSTAHMKTVMGGTV